MARQFHSITFACTLSGHSMRRYSKPIFSLAFAAIVIFLVWPVRALRSDNFVFYLPGSHQVVPITAVGGVRYLPLLPVLNIAGNVTAMQQKRNNIKIWVSGQQLELHVKEKRVRINKQQFKMSAPVRIVEGQAAVPLDFVTDLLPRLTGQTIRYQANSSRIFMGNVAPTLFSVHLSGQPNGAALTLSFSNPVNVQTVSSNGKWIIYLGHAPVEPTAQSFHFQNPFIKELQFDDQDGNPKLILTPAMANLNFFPTLAADERSLALRVNRPEQAATAQAGAPAAAPAAPAPAKPQPAAPAAAAGAAAGKPGGVPGAAPAVAAPVLPVVVVDAGHGGPDAGARSQDGVLEKNLNAQLADRLRQTLEASGKFRVVLTRSGDVNPSLEDRTRIANVAHPVAFLTLHAGEQGKAVPQAIVYTYLPPSLQAPAAAQPNVLFLPWATAQQSFAGRSQQLAAAVQRQLSLIIGLAVPLPEQAPIRQLRSVAAPAVAIELGSLDPAVAAAPLPDPNFQQQVANAVLQSLLKL